MSLQGVFFLYLTHDKSCPYGWQFTNIDKSESANGNAAIRAFILNIKTILLCLGLTTQTKFLDYRTVAVDVALVEIIEQTATLADEDCQRTLRYVVLVVLLKVLGQVSDTVREQCDLALCRTRVSV